MAVVGSPRFPRSRFASMVGSAAWTCWVTRVVWPTGDTRLRVRPRPIAWSSDFESLRKLGYVEAEAPDESSANCPGCGVPIAPEQTSCPDCAPVSEARAAKGLLRLLLFAKARAFALTAGLALTIVSTGVSLVPSYLTEPLVDRVLVPRTKDQSVPISLLYWYLGLMAGSAILAWLLAWARTYVMAWVSERISGDLRQQTYNHLLRLSLKFFGGRRTGDLMSRISSDTDRICTFLSVNLVDFATDVLLIVFTAAILVTRDPLLAAATLLPIPLGGCLVHAVRQRLRHGFEQGNRAWAAMTSVLADTIPGVRVVKAFAQEKREVERFSRANLHVVRVPMTA